MSRAALDVLDPDRWRRIESVLDAVLELDPADAAAHLVRACEGDPDLKRDIEALLDADRRSPDFLAVPAAASHAAPSKGGETAALVTAETENSLLVV